MDEVPLEASGIREFDHSGGGACLLLVDEQRRATPVAVKEAWLAVTGSA